MKTFRAQLRGAAALSLILSFAVLSTSMSSCNPATTVQPSGVDELLDAFDSGCNSGAWSAAALERSKRLTSIYQSLLSKASCEKDRNIQSALHGAELLQSALQNAMDRRDAFRDERVAEENSFDLLLLLQSAGFDDTTKAALAAKYADARYQMSYQRSRGSYSDAWSYHNQGAFGLVQFSDYAQTILTNTSGISSCIADNPAKAIELGTSVGVIAGTFSPPMIGLGIVAVSKLLELSVDAATTIPNANAIYESRKDRMPNALICGLEALTRDYCRARDAETLVSLDRGSNGAGESAPFFYGVELADRDLPILYQWLDQVVGGSGSASIDQSHKVNDQFARLNRIQSIHRNAEGILSDLSVNLKNPKFDQNAKLLKVKSALSDLILMAFYYGCGDGIACAYGDSPFTSDSPYRLVSLLAGKDYIEERSGEKIQYYIDRLGLGPYGDEMITLISRRTFALIDARRENVIAEFTDKVNIDPPMVIRSATAETAGELSAAGAIQKLFRFFDQYAYREGSLRDQDEILIRQVRPDLDSLYRDVTSKDATTIDRSSSIIGNTFEKFKLVNTNVFLPSHLQELIRNDLTTRYRRGDGPRKIDDILAIAGRDVDTLLQRANIGPVKLMNDLANAKSKTQGTLRQFRTFFTGSLEKAMKDRKKAADENGEPAIALGARTPNRTTLSQLCILTLISGMEWPSSIDKSICQGSKIISKDAKIELSFDELDRKIQEKRTPLDDRLCLHEDFLRVDRLAAQRLHGPGESSGAGSSGISAFSDASAVIDHEFWQQVLNQAL